MPERRPWTRQRIATLALAIATALVAVVLFGPALYQLTTGMTLEETTAQSRGELAIVQVDQRADLPASSYPGWLPGTASDITLKVQGPDASADVARKVDAAVGPAAQPPARCRATTTTVRPFDDGGRWPRFGDAPVLDCGGGWLLVIQEGRWYAWTAGDTSTTSG